MKQIFKFPMKYEEISLIFFILFLVSLFFTIRFIFATPEAFKTGAYSDFTSFQLFLGDILLTISFIFTLFSKTRHKNFPKGLILLGIWVILDVFLAKGSYFSLNLYFITRFLMMFVAYETIANFNLKNIIYPVFISFFGLSVVQAIIAITQFQLQHPLGLFKMGEQQIYPNISGIAKIVSGGTEYVRGYGTFFHPNLLSAFLVTALFMGLYLFLCSGQIWQKVLAALGEGILIFGLTVTFSRASFLGFAVGLLAFFGTLIWQKKFQKTHALLLAIILISSIAAGLTYGKFLSTRATINDSASLERVFYTKLGVKMLEQHWLFGTGIGESVLHMQQYAPFKLWPWQIQPVHNYFLLAAVEMGIVGAVVLLIFFLLHLIKLYLDNWKTRNHLSLILGCILLAFFLEMQFDHYFYTLVPTQYLLWTMLGLSLNQIKTAP